MYLGVLMELCVRFRFVSLAVSTTRNSIKAPLKTPKQKIIEDLEKVSHDFIRRRDGIDGEIRGYCFDCGHYAEGQQFQAGHFEPSGSCGALLRFHPHNMHGQRGGCNMKFQQETVKIAYTLAMLRKYGAEYVDFLRSLKNKTIKADIIFYQTLLDLYKAGDEKAIIDYLHSF